MNKITAVSILMSGECDAIMHGTSEFVLQGEDVVNKRSKKALDMKKMLEEGWDTKQLPRWDDVLKDGAERPTLCILENDNSSIIILSMTEDGDYVTSYGEIFDKDVYGQLRPATKEEALSLVADMKEAPHPRAKPKPKNEDKPKAKPEAVEDVAKQEVKTEDPAVIKGETDISETGETFAHIDLEEEELPATQDHPDAHPVAEQAPEPEQIDLSEEEIPFDVTEEPVSVAPTSKPVKEEACQTKTSKTTVMPKAEATEPDVEPEGEFISLGLSKDDWPTFKRAYEAAGLNMQEEANKGAGHCTSMIIQFAEKKAKAAKDAAEKHDSEEQIENKLEVFLDYGLEPEDAIAFYRFHKLDKYTLATLISDASDEEVGQKITQFYDETEGK